MPAHQHPTHLLTAMASFIDIYWCVDADVRKLELQLDVRWFYAKGLTSVVQTTNVPFNDLMLID